MSVVHHSLARAVHRAADETRTILTGLEQAGHPRTGQTGQTASLFLTLTSIETKLRAVDPPPPIDRFVPELERLVWECSGELATVRPLIEEALRIARQG